MKLGEIFRMQLSTVERCIAYGYARADIETRLPNSMHSGKHAGWWYDLTGYESSEYAEEIAQAVRYLTLRGLLLTHPEHENLVRPLDDPMDRVKATARPLRKQSIKSGGVH